MSGMLIIYDGRIPLGHKTFLENRFSESVMMPLDISRSSGVYDSIRCHPDIYLFQLDRHTMVYSPCMPLALLDLLRKRSVRMLEGGEDPGPVYPYTARYNALRFKDYIVCNTSLIDPVILGLAQEHGLECVHVEQGYARCSCVSDGMKGIVTADKGIYDALTGRGEDVLLVSSGSVELPGHETGFLGGASGKISEDRCIILGDLSRHPCGDRIRRYFSGKNVELVECGGLGLFDAGSVIFM